MGDEVAMRIPQAGSRVRKSFLADKDWGRAGLLNFEGTWDWVKVLRPCRSAEEGRCSLCDVSNQQHMVLEVVKVSCT